MNETPRPFTLSATHDNGCFIDYPTFEVTEEQMRAIFGKPNSPFSYCEEDKGYTGYWDFTDGEHRMSIGFRHGTARYSGNDAVVAYRLDAFLKDALTLLSMAEAA